MPSACMTTELHAIDSVHAMCIHHNYILVKLPTCPTSPGVARFAFSDLCEQHLAADDYNAICCSSARLTPKLDHLTNGEHVPWSKHGFYIPIRGDARQSVTNYRDEFPHGIGRMTVNHSYPFIPSSLSQGKFHTILVDDIPKLTVDRHNEVGAEETD